MKITSPPLEQKMEFHRLRAAGQFPGGHEGWKLYLEWRERPKTDQATSVLSIDDYEPPATAQEELGF